MDPVVSTIVSSPFQITNALHQIVGNDVEALAAAKKMQDVGYYFDQSGIVQMNKIFAGSLTTEVQMGIRQKVKGGEILHSSG